MKRKYIFGGLISIFFIVGYLVFSASAQTANTVGSLQISPSNVKNGGAFTIKLSGVDSIPANTVTRLFIDTDEGSGFSGFKDFGTWLNVGELKNGISRTMNCSAYSSYSPSGSVNVTGKTLSQKLYISYEGLNSKSEIVTHTKDCSVPSSGAACSVSPTSINITQNGTVNMSVSTNRTSKSGDLVYVTANGFPTGSYSSLGNGQVIEAGKNKKDFQVFSTNNANRGQAKFTVYCSTGCPVSGCPSGGNPEILGSAEVSINVTGNNPEPVVGGGGSSGGSSGSGSDACRVGSLVLPPNSSDRVDIGFNEIEDNISFSATPIGSGISSVSAYPNIRIARLKNGSGREWPIVHVKTSSDFSGQSSYSLACNYSHNGLSAVGTISAPVVSNPSGKVKLSQMEDLREVLFPSSVCDYKVKGCRAGFTDAPLSVLANATLPALVGADMISLNPAPAKGNTSHPRLFNLSDPMRPVDSGLTGQVRAGGDYDTAGDFGPYLAIISAAYSKDKTIWAGLSSQGNIYVWKDGKRYEDWNGSGSREINGIIKYGFSYILLTNSGSYDITNGMTSMDSGIDFLSGNMWRRDRLNAAPAGFPDMPDGKKIILGDDKHILDIVLPGRFLNVSGEKRLAIYAVDSSDVVAELELPVNTEREQFGTIPVTGGEYIYILRAPQSNSAMNYATYGSQFATIYRFDYATKKITEVVKDVVLSPGYISAHAAFGANTSNPGIVVSSFIYTDLAANARETKLQTYLISDLAQGKGVDVLSNSPVWTDNDHNMTSIASLTTGGATYIYTKDARVYKLEMGAASGGGSGGSTGGGGTGSGPTSTVPTYDCGFDLSFAPTDLSVKQGTYYANYTIKANSTSVNPFCTINVIPPSQNSIRSDYVNTLLVSPGGQTTMLLNVSKAAKGAYILPVKASAKGVPAKTYNVNLIVY